MQVRDCMNNNFVCLDSRQSVWEAVEAMLEANLDMVFVTDDSRKVIGVFSTRDLMSRVVFMNLNPLSVELEKVMTEKPAFLVPEESAVEAFQKLKSAVLNQMPVLEGGTAIGILNFSSQYFAQNPPMI